MWKELHRDKEKKVRAKNIPAPIKECWDMGEELTLISMVDDQGEVKDYLIQKSDGTGYYASTITNAVGYNAGRFQNLFEKM